MPGTVVAQCGSTFTRLRSSSSTPTASSPRPSVYGRRPMAISTMSACIVSGDPPLTGSTVTLALSALATAADTFMPRPNFKPCLCQMRWNLVQRQRAGGGDNLLLIDRYARQWDTFAAAGDDDVLRGVIGATDIDRTGRGNPANALQPGDLVLAEQELDPLGVGTDDLGLAGLHSIKVQPDAIDQHAVVLKRVSGVFELLGRLEQCFRRDATDVQAGSAQG